MKKPTEMTPDDTEFAGEYVLRVLPDAAHRAAATRAAADPAFAAEIREWEDRLVSLTDEIMPVVPSIETKKVLMDRLFGVDEKPSFLGNLGLWMGLSSVLVAAVASLVVYTFVPGIFGPDAPRFVTELEAVNDDLRILAVYDAGAETVQITRTAGVAQDGRALQLWCIVEGKAPWSVGVLSGAENETLSLPIGWIDGVRSWSLAVSDEPLGGSPTGQPSGTLLATAPMTQL
jgi:anti-sigma-K factor RskA